MSLLHIYAEWMRWILKILDSDPFLHQMAFWSSSQDKETEREEGKSEEEVGDEGEREIY